MFVEEEKWSTGVHSVSNDFMYKKHYVGLKHQDLPVIYFIRSAAHVVKVWDFARAC